MITHIRLTAFVFVACFVLAVVAERRAVPVTQVDLYGRDAVAPVLARLQPVDAVASALAALPVEHQGAFAAAPSAGSALAAGPSLDQAMAAVDITAVEARRLRIRVATGDEAAAHIVAESLRSSLIDAGLDERFSIYSSGSSNLAALALWLATALTGGLLLLQAGLRLFEAAKIHRSSVGPMQGVASI